ARRRELREALPIAPFERERLRRAVAEPARRRCGRATATAADFEDGEHPFVVADAFALRQHELLIRTTQGVRERRQVFEAVHDVPQGIRTLQRGRCGRKAPHLRAGRAQPSLAKTTRASFFSASGAASRSACSAAASVSKSTKR